MSYCRWSSDDWMSDVYVYEADEGFVTHVSSQKRVYHAPLPAEIERRADNVMEWYERDRAVMNAPHDSVPIGLPHDGASFSDDTAGECADRLESLRALGYHVPQHAIDALRDNAEATP